MTMKPIAVGVLVIGLVAVARAQQVDGAPELQRSIRDGDQERVSQLLGQGADPNIRDGSGATALMNAAAFAPLNIVRLLLDHGADPKLTDTAGATALMWGTHDVERVRLLLAAGADANAARPDGMTALLSAALRGRTDVMRMLLDAGADRRRGAVMAPGKMGLSAIALTTDDPAIRAFADPSDTTPAELREWTPPPLTVWLNPTGYGRGPQPAWGRVKSLRAVLNAGADPNETVTHLTLKVPVLSRVLRLNDLETVRLLLERGANPNTAGSRGLTPLMMAAATEHGAAEVQMLLDKGARVDARDENGETALDWALRLGETDAARLLRRAGAVARGRAFVAPPSVTTPRTAFAAVEAAIEPLQLAAPVFNRKAGCISCHQQSLPSVAVARAHASGAKTNRDLARHPTEATLAIWARSREQMLLGNCAVFGFLGNVTYGLFGFAEEDVAPSPVTDAVISCLGGLQKADGSWEGNDTRPPLADRNPIVYTALAMRGLRRYGVPGKRAETTARVARALIFMRRAEPQNTQDDAFKLLGLAWGGAPAADISRQARRVRALQRADGGWSQMPSKASDAYATGQALFALRTADTMANDEAYRRGVAYLLRTQLEDGTWYVRSRAIGFQPYIDSGFPHGPDQFISSAATSWAVMALTHAVEDRGRP